MRIIVLGDTHIPKRAKELPSRLIEELKNAELIIHTGDWSSMEVYEELRQFAEVKGVTGNVESDEVIEFFPKRTVIEAGGFRLGVIHGDGTKWTTERRALEAFSEEQVDVILFGHSHIPYLRYHKKKLLINPGSPTDKRQSPFKSFVILDIQDTIRPSFVFF